MGQRHILHCDCNCFYASVEMQEHPELRGKSIAVCGDPEARHGIVLTASYPAKRMGVKTGMPIWEAKQHCRDLIIVPASYGKYQKYSGYVREVFNDYTDQVESFGLDEAWLDITGSVGLFGSPVKIANEISVRIKRELGITVSIGVSFNKITAKLGSDYKKPDAITIIEPENYKEIVYPLPAGDLLYVGAATQRKLGNYGIRTIGQLAEMNPEVLKGWFGVMGYTLSAFARGLDQTPVAKQDAHSAIKSVGNSATTPRDLTTDEDVWLMLVLLSESVAMRMRDLGSKCNVVEIYVRDNELSGFTRRRKLDSPTNVSIEIARIAFDLFKRNYSWPKPLRSIGVRGADLCPADCAVQLGFFSNEEKREKLEHIDKAVDTLRQRYGYRSVQRAVVCWNGQDITSVHPGKCLHFDADSFSGLALDVYEGIDYQRNLHITEDSLVDEFLVQGKPGVYDYVFHLEPQLQLECEMPLEDASLGFSENGYQHVEETKKVLVLGDKAVLWAVFGELRMKIELQLENGQELFLLKTKDNPVNQTRRSILVRARGEKVRYSMQLTV